MNRAGAAEILCSHTALFDWQLAREAGVDVQFDENLRRSTQEELDRLDDYASAIGADNIDAFVEIIEVGAKFARGFTAIRKRVSTAAPSMSWLGPWSSKAARG